VQFAFAAAAEALAEAEIDLEQEDKTRVGLVLGANYGGMTSILENLVRLHQKGPSFVSPYTALAFIPSAPVGQLSIHYGMRGYSKTVVNDSASGTIAVGAAYRAVRRGDVDVVVAGGFESAIAAESAVVAMSTWEGLCRDAPDPTAAFRPFDVNRGGVVLAEGGAAVILESLDRAKARGAPIYAEISGYAQTFDAVDLRHFAADGVQYARAMELAVGQGDLGPEDVDYVNADGHATAEGDRAEATALHRLLGERTSTVPVSAPKSMIGNALAGAGAIDIAFAALAMRHGMIPPTINLEEQDPECRLRLVANKPEEATIDVALVASRGMSGANAALVLRKPA
jgi:3-oxoacyl-[acyl-carrier-protein] synthase II